MEPSILAGITQNQLCLSLDIMGTEPGYARTFGIVETDGGFEPKAVANGEGDGGDRRIEKRGSQLRDPIESDFGLAFQDLIVIEYGYSIELALTVGMAHQELAEW